MLIFKLQMDVEKSLNDPPCHISPKIAKSSYFKPIISILLACGIYLIKKQVNK